MAVRAAVVLAGIIVVIGSFGPWVTVFGGIGKVNGTDGDGWITLALALIGACLVAWRPRTTATAVIALLCGLVIATVATIDLADLGRVAGESELADALVDTGWGLYFCLVGGWLLAMVAMFQLLTEAPGIRFFREPDRRTLETT